MEHPKSEEEPKILSLDDPGRVPVEGIKERADIELRQQMTDKMLALFERTNLFVLGGLATCFIVDGVFVGTGTISPRDRLVTENVLMALLGATTVQLGSLVLIAGRYVFQPSRPRKERVNSRHQKGLDKVRDAAKSAVMPNSDSPPDAPSG